MRLGVLIPGNFIGGGTKMPARLASHLAERHEITLLYPRIPHYVTYHRLRRTSVASKVAYVIREAARQPRWFELAPDLSTRVRLVRYGLLPDPARLRALDAIIYVSVWQYHELKDLSLPRVARIHWTLADYVFASGTSGGFDSILEAYTGGDVIVAPSEATKVDLERYGVTVRAVIPGGVDPVFHNRGRREPGERVRVLAYFQPAWWVKGAATLVQAMRQLRMAFPDVHITLFGHQPSDIALSGRGICDHFVSGLTSAQVADLYREHDVFIYPSYTDGFPAPPLEAMACGCAVATTAVGAIPEYAAHDVNALLVRPMDYAALYDAAARLIRDPALRGRLGGRAAADAPQWTWGRAAERFERLLEAMT